MLLYGMLHLTLVSLELLNQLLLQLTAHSLSGRLVWAVLYKSI